MKKLKENTLDIERKIQVRGHSIASKMQNLQRSTDEIANVAGLSLEKQKQLLDGQSEALKGLTSLTKFLTQALEDSRATLHELAEYGQKQQDELLRGQEQLKQTHDHLFENLKSILDTQSWVESNMFCLRSTFLLLIALSLSLYSIHSYRDYEQLNYQLLLAFRDKIEALEKSVVTMYLTLESDAEISSWVDTDYLEDEDICHDPDYILPKVVAENLVTTHSLSTKYNLRPRHHKSL